MELHLKKEIPEKEILKMVSSIASAISLRLSPPIQLICVLDAALPFAMALSQELDVDKHIAYVRCKSYNGTTATRTVKVQPLSKTLFSMDTVLVDTIFDTGNTMGALVEWLSAEYAINPHIAALLVRDINDNTSRVDFFGTRIKEGEFVVGYGLDYSGRYRNLPDIHVLVPGEDS